MARFPNASDLRRVFIMMQRYPVLPENGLTTTSYEDNQDYEAWWGYLRYDPDGDQPQVNETEPNGVLTIEREERQPLQPLHGWPGNPLSVDVVMSRSLNRGFEALVQEHVGADAGDEE